MKTATTALINFLNSARTAPDAPIAFADCFTFILSTGAVLTYTNVDRPIVYNGYTFAANGPLVQGPLATSLYTTVVGATSAILLEILTFNLEVGIKKAGG